MAARAARSSLKQWGATRKVDRTGEFSKKLFVAVQPLDSRNPRIASGNSTDMKSVSSATLAPFNRILGQPGSRNGFAPWRMQSRNRDWRLDYYSCSFVENDTNAPLFPFLFSLSASPRLFSLAGLPRSDSASGALVERRSADFLSLEFRCFLEKSRWSRKLAN